MKLPFNGIEELEERVFELQKSLFYNKQLITSYEIHVLPFTAKGGLIDNDIVPALRVSEKILLESLGRVYLELAEKNKESSDGFYFQRLMEIKHSIHEWNTKKEKLS
jgi:hypothetical protein